MTLPDFLIFLCSFAPCTFVGGDLHVPVPEVSARMPSEQWPRYPLGSHCVVFTPMPVGI